MFDLACPAFGANLLTIAEAFSSRAFNKLAKCCFFEVPLPRAMLANGWGSEHLQDMKNPVQSLPPQANNHDAVLHAARRLLSAADMSLP